MTARRFSLPAVARSAGSTFVVSDPGADAAGFTLVPASRAGESIMFNASNGVRYTYTIGNAAYHADAFTNCSTGMCSVAM